MQITHNYNTKDEEDSELLAIFAEDILKHFAEWLNEHTDELNAAIKDADRSTMHPEEWYAAADEANIIRNKLYDLSMGWLNGNYFYRAGSRSKEHPAR